MANNRINQPRRINQVRHPAKARKPKQKPTTPPAHDTSGEAGELIPDAALPQRIREQQALRLLPALVSSGSLAKHLSVTRSTVWRWRITGFLPKPIRTELGYFWDRQTLSRWVQAGKPWAHPELRTVAQEHARAHHYSLSEYVAPEPWQEQGETPLETSGVDQLEAGLNDSEQYVDDSGIDALLDRLDEEDDD